MHALTTPSATLADLDDRQNLDALLAAALTGAPRARVSVAWRSGGRITTAAHGVEPLRDWAAPVGCIAKLLTAILVLAAVTERRCTFETPVAELLGAEGAMLRGVTLRQLLEHTHGLDDSLLAPPRYSIGFVDSAELLERVAALQRSWSPGALYSYGNLGPWLAAAVLENLHGRSYGALVREALWPVAARAARAVRLPLCAAVGGGLQLTAAELLRLVSRAWPARAGAAWDEGAVTPLPGWNPLERGVLLGFKHAGGEWMGHQSTWPHASIFVRFAPRREQALVVLSRDQPAALVAVRVFGAYLPELFDLRLPWRERVPCGRPDAHWCGRFEQAASIVAIAAGGGTLRAFSASRDASGVRHGAASAVLEPAAGGVWLARPATELVPYAQFVTHDEAGTLLWNGRCLLRRTAEN
jgi:CubicO group peptidase (beta-lactamase class C family)